MERTAKEEVLRRLKAPSSAEFSDIYVNVNEGGGGFVMGKVDAQNAFGAMLRKDFNISMKCENESLIISHGMFDGETWGADFKALNIHERLQSARSDAERDSIESAIREDMEKMYSR